MQNKKGRIGVIFILVLIISGFIWYYFDDIKIAAIIFFGFIFIKIISNFLKKEEINYYE